MYTMKLGRNEPVRKWNSDKSNWKSEEKEEIRSNGNMVESLPPGSN